MTQRERQQRIEASRERLVSLDMDGEWVISVSVIDEPVPDHSVLSRAAEIRAACRNLQRN